MKKWVALILFVVLVALTACGRVSEPANPTAERDENLAKLGKVWGFAKYTHHSFITGQLSWDAELLRLIPIIYHANVAEVNGILYDWFASLGEDGYDLPLFPDLHADTETDEARRPMADLSWIKYEYIGALAARLLRFDGIRAGDRTAAPAHIHGVVDFSNQSHHTHMDFADAGYRLLGLFRLWNAMKYFFPHLDVLDVAWNDLLVEFIPRMLSGTDRLSYELTLAAMAHHLHDAHVAFFGAQFLTDRFGAYRLPAHLVAAEGRLVVYERFGGGIPLMRGDVILRFNGECVDEIIAEKLAYLSFPNEARALAYLSRGWSGIVLNAHSPAMEITLLRAGVEMTVTTNAGARWAQWLPQATQSHVLLENNIGLINPSIYGGVRYIMESFAQTDGIIIDLRQRPANYAFFLEMRQYLMAVPLPFAYISLPSPHHPGARMDVPVNQYLPPSPYAFVYDRPVVLLMDERTFSHPEWVIMSFRVAPNVTVVGPFSMGSNGNVAALPLPGGLTMWFTSLGVYTPEGGQTHRVGLTPDRYVNRTIQDVAEGRDEVLELAIQFLMEG